MSGEGLVKLGRIEVRHQDTPPTPPDGTVVLYVKDDNRVYIKNSAGQEFVISDASTPPSGSVTSVGLELPASLFTVTGSPVTSSGTLTGALANQAAATVFAAPAASVGTPSFRALAAGDVPNLDAAKITSGILAVARGGTGAGTAGAALTSLGAVATTDSRLSDARPPTAHTHAAGDITSGTLAVARLPATVAQTNALNTFTATQTMQAGQFLVGEVRPEATSMSLEDRACATTGTLVTHFRGDTAPPAGYALAGSPYITPGSAVWSNNNDFANIRNDTGTASAYCAKSLTGLTTSTQVLVRARLFPINGAWAWVQIDDGTDS
ncbi:MAG: hypothetical protein HC911_18040, partial [Chloroflexaceae bacterium]|nr:hypothetical protein [Chloroflexaceae bacterium]